MCQLSLIAKGNSQNLWRWHRTGCLLTILAELFEAGLSELGRL